MINCKLSKTAPSDESLYVHTWNGEVHNLEARFQTSNYTG